jgi:hypothetical protein
MYQKQERQCTARDFAIWGSAALVLAPYPVARVDGHGHELDLQGPERAEATFVTFKLASRIISIMASA